MAKKSLIATATAVALLAGALFGVSLTPASANHLPANRVSAAGAETEVAGPGEEVTLLSTQIRSSQQVDLVMSVTAECSIVTDVTTIGNDSQFAEGKVEVWVEIDGNPVPVSSANTDEGRVVFCNRLYQRDTSLFDDEDATIRTFQSTRAANGFNWMALNVGTGIHLIEVKANLTVSASQEATADAVVGNRTLIIEPTHAAHDEEVTSLS